MSKRVYLVALIILAVILTACTPLEEPADCGGEDGCLEPPEERIAALPPDPPEPPQQQEQPIKSQKTELPEVNLYEDLIITDRTHIINRSKLFIHGNLVVNGTGKLVALDSEIIFVQDYNQQYRAYFDGDAVLDFRNVKLSTQGKWFNLAYTGNARAVFRNVHGDDCCNPWHGSTDNSSFDIKNSTVGITVSNNVKVVADNSNLFFELVLTDSKGRFKLPKGHVDELKLAIPNNEDKIINLTITDSSFHQWGLTIDHHADVTFVDSYLTIGLNVGSDWRQPPSKVTFKGLKAKTYDDFSLSWDSNFLKLEDTEVTSWYPQAWNGATINIEDSDLADLQNNGDDTTIIVRNSKVAIAIARLNVIQKYYDSVIDQDVIVHDDAKIYLYNTKVGGKMVENGNGKIFIDGMPLGS